MVPRDLVNLIVYCYPDPTILGTNITISCVDESKQTENYENMSSVQITCMKNRRWEPDPREIIEECNSFKHTTS